MCAATLLFEGNDKEQLDYLKNGQGQSIQDPSSHVIPTNPEIEPLLNADNTYESNDFFEYPNLTNSYSSSTQQQPVNFIPNVNENDQVASFW